MRAKRKSITRFLEKIRVDGQGCWIWRGHQSPAGYGRFRLDDNRTYTHAHRWAYEYFVGPIPEGLHIHHECHQKACVNPLHLHAVTPAENMRFERKPICKNGHARDIDDDDRRTSCRACHRERYLHRMALNADEERAKSRERRRRWVASDPAIEARLKERLRKYYLANRDKIKAQDRARYLANREKITARVRARYLLRKGTRKDNGSGWLF